MLAKRRKLDPSLSLPSHSLHPNTPLILKHAFTVSLTWSTWYQPTTRTKRITSALSLPITLHQLELKELLVSLSHTVSNYYFAPIRITMKDSNSIFATQLGMY
ncbi:hypothetical protein RND81_07G046500 [Saponaria officinalis]|uniref:Uncharacterized protein n=1 Tax=Saponaria officinalis TaxID=3572 RepID=A0AAW1JKD6_SAPOF